MEIAIILTDVVIKIILLALIIFSGAVLAAILWVVYVYNKEDKDGNKTKLVHFDNTYGAHLGSDCLQQFGNPLKVYIPSSKITFLTRAFS